MDFFKRTKGEGVFMVEAKQFKEFVKALEESQCRLLPASKGEPYCIELRNLIKPELKPVVYQFHNLKQQSFMKQVIASGLEDNFELQEKVDTIGRLKRAIDQGVKEARETQVILSPEDSSSDQYSSEELSKQSVVRTKAVYTTDEEMRGRLRMKILEILRESNQLSASEMRKLLEQAGYNEPENSIKQIMREFCDGQKTKRGGLKFLLKEQFRAAEVQSRRK